MARQQPQIDLNTVIATSIHDMKNSLSLVLNAAEEACLAWEKLPGDIESNIQQVRYEGKRLNNNFMQLLSLYRIDQRQYSANITDNEVYDCLEEAMLENQDTLALNNIEIGIDCNESMVYFFDRALVMGILNTVINNAYRYARSEVLLRAKEKNGFLVLEVRDDGIGYSPQILDAQEGQKNIDFNIGNTGLGLHFASVVAQMHQHKDRQGHIKLSNISPIGGACFSIYLPC